MLILHNASTRTLYKHLKVKVKYNTLFSYSKFEKKLQWLNKIIYTVYNNKKIFHALFLWMMGMEIEHSTRDNERIYNNL